MNTKHTPGPWNVRNYGTDEAGNEMIHIEDQIGRTIIREMGHQDVIHHNARLIAAAPELLDIVRRLGAKLADECGEGEVHPMAKEAAYLIAKATGETI